MPLDAETQKLIESALRVVLDFFFWSRSMRDNYRDLLRPLGVEPETIYLATPRSIALARIRARTMEHSDDFHLSEELAAEYFDHFEVPTLEEGPLTVISGA
jgi:predicted kinase